MSEIERIQRYIERTPVNEDRYYMGSDEAAAIVERVESMPDILKAISFAFKYGRAKGYRAAKAKRRAAV